MTKLLAALFQKAADLPPFLQDDLAILLEGDLETICNKEAHNSQEWQAKMDVSRDVLDMFVADMEAEIEAGTTRPLPS